MSANSVLILGGAGFLGYALTKRLSQEGMAVDVVTRSAIDREFPVGVRVHRSSLDNQELMHELLGICKCVVHAASGSTPGSSRTDPVGECAGNLIPSLKFLQVLQEHSSIPLVYLSSGGTVYGDAPATPVTETTVLAPRSFYGAGKAACEMFLQAYASQLARPVVALRPSNLYGPGQPSRPGFGIVRRLLDCAFAAEPVHIWGDGSARRDYLYIDDLVEACVRAIDYAPRHGVMSTFNVCSGASYSIDALCDVVERVTGRRLERCYRPGRSLDVRQSAIDASRIRDALGWEAAVDLLEGVSRTWEWLQCEASRA